jgi:hypothetical protein
MPLLGTGGGGHGRRGGGQHEELVAEYGHDTKYAMHCARLGFQCIELLTTNQLQLPIKASPPNGCAPSDAATSASTTGGRRTAVDGVQPGAGCGARSRWRRE